MNINNTVQEKIEAVVKEQSLKILLDVNMSSTEPFEFNVSIDTEGKIVLTPTSKDDSFVSAQLINTEDANESTIIIDATILSEADRPIVLSAFIDDIGQCVIESESSSDSFITATLGDSLNLITEEETEASNKDEENSEEENIPKDVEAEVIVESFNSEDMYETLVSITDNFTEPSGGIRCDTVEEHDYCYEVISSKYNVVNSTTIDDKYEIIYSEPMLLLTEEVKEETKMNILIRFLQGDITLVNDPEVDVKDEFILITSTEDADFYYDPESDVIGVYNK